MTPALICSVIFGLLVLGLLVVLYREGVLDAVALVVGLAASVVGITLLGVYMVMVIQTNSWSEAWARLGEK